jgi:hypothetical protein
VTNDRANEILARMAAMFRKQGYAPKQFRRADLHPSPAEAREHAHWMALEALTIPADKIGTKFTWIGWIQCTLWQMGGFSIDEMRAMNMPVLSTTG